LHLHEHSERDRIGQLRAAAVIAADAVIAVSDSVAASLPKVARNRVEVIRNGIDPVRFAPGTPSAELRRQLRGSGDDPVVLALSRYEPTKGLEDLIRAIARLPDDLRHVRLVLAGGSKEEGSPFAQNLFDLARRLLGPRAQFLGFREDVCELLRVSDVCVLPSHIEGLGLVVLEAQATGCPVVASDTGGVPELIEHGVTGLLFPVGDVDRLAGAITSVLRDGDLRSRLSTNARQRVVDHSTLARQADAEVAVVRRVVGRRHRGVR
jgi:glycogen(starch) synthase